MTDTSPVAQCKTCVHFDPQPAPGNARLLGAQTDFERAHVPCAKATATLKTHTRDSKFPWHWVRPPRHYCRCRYFESLGHPNLLWLANPDRHPD